MGIDEVRRALVAPLLISTLAAGCAPARSGIEPVRSSSTITAEDLRNPNEPIEVVLQRKVPGLLVTRGSDGSLSLQIRGSSSMRGAATPPLYVLNGSPFEPGPGGALAGIIPEDIETIRVLTPAQSGLYGIDGANGVIEITTRQAGRRKP